MKAKIKEKSEDFEENEEVKILFYAAELGKYVENDLLLVAKKDGTLHRVNIEQVLVEYDSI